MIVVFTKSADAELLEIEAHIATENPAAAVRVVDGLVAACVSLGETPNKGFSIAKLRGVKIRQLVHRPYLILYSVSPGAIRIHRVFHGSRSPKLLLKGLDPS